MEITIDKISEDKIYLNVGGEVKEIKRQLEDLKQLLQNNNRQTIQYADKIYNIENINEANFGFVTGKKSFNETLTRQLTEAIAPYSPDAKKVLDYVNQNRIENWEGQAKFAKKAKEIIAYSFMGVLGVQLSRLFAIGNEHFSEEKQKNYIAKCLFIGKVCLDLACFGLISALWSRMKQSPPVIQPEQEKCLDFFFKDPFESDFIQRKELIIALMGIFENQDLPFPEMKDLAKDSQFPEICQKMQSLDEKLNKEDFSLLECQEAEEGLAGLLSCFNFFADYKMASIRNIGYKKLRITPEKFIHRFTALGIDNKANQDAEKTTFSEYSIETESILVYKGENYHQSLNLFPFVIDYNVLSMESGTKICFFQNQEKSDGENVHLKYLFLEDGSILSIESKKMELNPADFNADKEQFKIMNKNYVTAHFQDAEKQLLGAKANDDFNDLFS